MNTATHSNDIICPCDFSHQVRRNSLVPSIVRIYKFIRTVIHFNERTVCRAHVPNSESKTERPPVPIFRTRKLKKAFIK